MEIWELVGPRALEMRSRPDPEPEEGDVVVDIACTAVSPGTELFAYRSGPTSMMVAPGYLAAGTVRTVGASVDAGLVGRGVLLSAPHGSVARVDAAGVTLIPDGVDFEGAVFTHLAGLGHSCLHSGDYRAGDDVAVVGAGLVGMSTALVAEMVGARVHVIDIDPVRLELPARLGFEVYDAGSDDVGDAIRSASVAGPAIVVDTSGSWAGFDTAVRIARKRSRVCVLGVNRVLPTAETGRAVFDELLTFPARFHYEGLRIIGCAGHQRDGDLSRDDWTLGRCRSYLLETMAQGRLDLTPLVTERVSPGDLPRIMERFDAADERPFGVVIDWR
ncbi:MAG: zinc-binding alcohol dehydrogenase [Acidimicrobiia bacterium]